MDEFTERYARRNFILGVANGVIFMAGSALLDPATILPAYLATIVKSNALIGLGSMLMGIGWQLPQALVAYWLRSLRHRKPAYIFGNTTRLGFVGLFVLSMILFNGNTRLVGASYFFCLTLAGLGAGTVGLAYQDIVARTIPPHRRGAYNAYRIIGGQGILALAGSILARWVLARPEVFPYPWNYALIFGFAWFVMSVGVVMFSLMKEPEEKTAKSRPPFKKFVFEMYLIVKRDAAFSTFLFVRMLRSFELLAVSFYIVFASSILGLGDSAAGTFLTVRLATTFVAALLWGRMSDRSGTRAVIRLSSIASAAAPAFALVVALLVAKPAVLAPAARAGAPAAEAATAPAGGETTVAEPAVLRVVGGGWLATVLVMSPVFILMTLGTIGGWIGPQNHLMEIAPPRRRPLYLGLSTSFDGILVLTIPAVGGAVIDAVNRFSGGRMAGYVVTFALSCVLVCVSAVLSSRLSGAAPATGGRRGTLAARCGSIRRRGGWRAGGVFRLRRQQRG